MQILYKYRQIYLEKSQIQEKNKGKGGEQEKNRRYKESFGGKE